MGAYQYWEHTHQRAPLHLLFANLIFAMEFTLLLKSSGVEKWAVFRPQMSKKVPSGQFIDAKH